MVLVLIKYDESFSININQVESIHNLKEKIKEKTNIKIEEQILYHNGKLLNDDISIFESNILNNDTIHLSKIITGGFDSFSILLLLAYLIFIMLYILLLLSGLIPIISHVYSYILEWIITRAVNLFNLGKNRYVIALVWIVMFIIKVFIIYFFMYAFSAFLIFPIVYYFKDHLCGSFRISNDFGFILSLSFVILYGLLSIPDEVLAFARYIGDLSIYADLVTSPFLSFLQEFADIGKFGAFYAIPYIGTPFLEGYHNAVSVAAELVKDGVDLISDYNCDNEKSLKMIGKIILNWEKIPELKNWVQSYNAQTFMEVIPIAIFPEINNYYACKVNNMPFWQKINPRNSISGEYYASKGALKGFCTALNIVRAISGFLDSLGGSMQIANMIKTGNVAGLLTLILAPLIALIMWLSGRL